MSAIVPPNAFDRLLTNLRSIIRQEIPVLTYHGIYEYSVQSLAGSTVNCDPVDTTIPLPSLANIELRPSLLGEVVTSPFFPGSRCLVAFVNGDPSRPFVMSILGTPASVAITAGFQVATEHVMTLEATVVLIYNFMSAFIGLVPALPATYTTLAMTNALTVYSNTSYIPPPTAIAQAPFATAQAANFVAGSLVTSVAAAWVPLISAALLAKVPNASSLFPSLGSSNVKTG